MSASVRGPSPRELLPIVQVQTPQIVQRSAPPAMWLPATALAASMAIAAAGGTVLGVLAALDAGVAAGHWFAVVQAHAMLQLWGWFAVSISALVFEFVVRLNRHAPLPTAPRVAALLSLGAGALASAGAGAFGAAHGSVAVAGAVLLVAGSVQVLLLILRVAPARPLVADLHPLFFRTGAAWLVVSAALVLVGAWGAPAGVVAPPVFDATVDVFLLGFCLNVIVAVGLRAFPGHLGLPPVPVRRQRVLWVLLNAATLLRLATAPVPGLPGPEAAASVVGLVVAGALLWMTAIFGIARAVRAWGRASERHQVLVPVAWVGLAAYAIAEAAQAGAALLGQSASLLAAGGVRHLLMAGFVAPLLIAMIHVVLERFGTGRVVWREALTAAFALLVLAWPLRALPPILDPAGGELTRASMGVAGALLSLGLCLATAVAARNAVEVVRFARQFRRLA